MTKIAKFNLRIIRDTEKEYDLSGKVTTPEQAYSVFKKTLELDQRAEEVLAMLTVDIRGFVTGVFEISHGTIDASFTHPREVFKRALMQNSAGIILGHNHPSGNPEPSENDINVTKKIVGGGNLLDIDVLDHLILGNDRFYSLKQHDKM